MREILFRGKDLTDEWLYGLPTKICDVFTSFRSVNGGYSAVCKTETIGQFTGLTDCNGNKIFEGDVVKYTYRHRQTELANYFMSNEPHLDIWETEDYLDDKNCVVSISNGMTMFGEYSCLHQEKEIDDIAEDIMFGDNKPQHGWDEYFEIDGKYVKISNLIDRLLDKYTDDNVNVMDKLKDKLRIVISLCYSIEVVGNIHDNHELIKGGKQ